MDVFGWKDGLAGRCCPCYVATPRYVFLERLHLSVEADRYAGSGAGHAIEDGHILGRALKDYFTEVNDLTTLTRPLAVWTQVYQNVRRPRAQKAQITSRQAGDVYEMQGEDFKGLSYNDCLPIVADKLKHRMKWVWGGNIDAEYDKIVQNAQLPN